MQNSREIPISKYKSVPIKHKTCHNNLIDTKNNTSTTRHRQQMLYQTITFIKRIIFSNGQIYYQQASFSFRTCSEKDLLKTDGILQEQLKNEFFILTKVDFHLFDARNYNWKRVYDSEIVWSDCV